MGAVFLHLGLIPPEPLDVPPNKERDQSAFDLAKRNHAQEFPQLVADLCNVVRPFHLQPTGREPVSARDLMYGAIRYVEMGGCMREVESYVREAHASGLIEKPYSYPLISQYLNHPKTQAEIERLLLIAFVSTAHFSRSAGPDGTGFQRFNYGDYAQDRARSRLRKAKKETGRVLPLDALKRRGYLHAVPLIVYETNMVPAVQVLYRHSLEADSEADFQDESVPTGETPYFLSLLERVRPFFPGLKEVRADLGYFKFLHYHWGQCWGIRTLIPFKSNYRRRGASSRSGAHAVPAAARAYDEWMASKDAFDRDYHKRSQQEGTMNGCKIETGHGIRTRQPEAQKNEVRLKWLVYSLKQVLRLKHEEGWTPDFQAAAMQVGETDLVPLEALAQKYLGKNAGLIIAEEAAAARRTTGSVSG